VLKLLRISLLFLSLLFIGESFGQIGGRQTYQFLTLTSSARVAGLGGDFLAVRDNDISLTLANPSLITKEMNNDLSLDFVNYFTSLNYGDIIFSHSFDKFGSFTGAFQFINYGKMTRADETGATYGEFSASEYAVNIGWARNLGPHFSIGANGKLVYSHLDVYNSVGIGVDVAGSYFSKEDLFTASLIFSNLGTQIVSYRPGPYEALPFQIQIGISQRLRHIPLRFSLLYNHLEKWNLRYDDPNDPANQKDPLTGETKTKSDISKFADNFMRHIVIGTELTIAKTLSLRIGYNYGRRQEMKLYGKAGMSGFSYGVGVRIKMFSVSYTRSTYMAGPINPNYFSVAVKLGEFTKKQ
jgi:hypothetical protein